MRRILRALLAGVACFRSPLVILAFGLAVWVAKEPGCGPTAQDLGPTTHKPELRHPRMSEDDLVTVPLGDGTEAHTTWREARPYYERGDVELLKTILRVRAAEAAAGTSDPTDEENCE